MYFRKDGNELECLDLCGLVGSVIFAKKSTLNNFLVKIFNIGVIIS